MSMEVWADDGEENYDHLLDAGWIDADQARKLAELISDLSLFLRDEGCDFTPDGIDSLRRRVADALPTHMLPHWLCPLTTQERADEQQ